MKKPPALPLNPANPMKTTPHYQSNTYLCKRSSIPSPLPTHHITPESKRTQEPGRVYKHFQISTTKCTLNIKISNKTQPTTPLPPTPVYHHQHLIIKSKNKRRKNTVIDKKRRLYYAPPPYPKCSDLHKRRIDAKQREPKCFSPSTTLLEVGGIATIVTMCLKR